MARVKRIVLFKFKDETSTETVGEIFDGLKGLQDVIPGIEDYVDGAYSSTDGMNKDFTHAFIMTFSDEAARDGFGPHEAHQSLVNNLVGPNVADVLAFDFLA